MSTPQRASDTPFGIDVEAGRTYWWCSCGQSRSQPFCDGSHKGSAFAPHKFVATETTRLWFCGCKASRNAPFCDGSHRGTAA